MRDCLHPADLVPLVERQLALRDARPAADRQRRPAGATRRCRCAQLSDWCRGRIGAHEVASDTRPRPFDLPWVVLDSALAGRAWGWRPQRTRDEILDEILRHAQANPHWLELSETA